MSHEEDQLSGYFPEEVPTIMANDGTAHATEQMAKTRQLVDAEAANTRAGRFVDDLSRFRPVWQSRANCRGSDPDLFFPPEGNEREEDKEAREAKAKAICAGCPVRMPCLEGAIARRETAGIWGGLNEAERGVAKIRKRK